MENETQQYTGAKFDFGTSFQYKIITNILKDRSFANSMLELLNPQYFSTNSMAWLCNIIQTYMNTYKTIPTIDALKTLVQTNIKNVSTEEKQQIQNDLTSIFSYMGSDDLHFVQDQAIIFCKNEELAHAIYKSVDYLKDKNFDAIKIVIDNAMKKGTSSDIGMIYDSYDAIEYRYSVKRGNLIKTPWSIINDVSAGGFGPGELIVIVAPSGVGKSWLLQSIGARLIQMDKTIVHYTLELDDIYTSMRYDKIIMGEPQPVDPDPHKIAEKLKEKIRIQNNSIIKYYPTKTATINTIRSHLDKMIMNGYKPDAIIIDYADLLKPVVFNKDGERFNIDEIYKELRGLAGEYKCPVFTASQTNRGGVNKEIISSESIAESYGKVMIADFIMTISRTQDDTDKDNPDIRTSRVYIAKNRFGPDGITYNCRFNFKNGLINMYNETSKESDKIDETRMSNILHKNAIVQQNMKAAFNQTIHEQNSSQSNNDIDDSDINIIQNVNYNNNLMDF